VDFGGLAIVDGETFRWSGRYDKNFSERVTLHLALNVFEDFHPAVPDEYVSTPFVFLANIHPDLQLEVLDSLDNPHFVAADTMNCWIGEEMERLKEVMKRVDLLFVNDGEAREISGENDLILASQRLLDMGPRMVIVKKGGHGAFIKSDDFYFTVPAYPTERVVDPTGAGDSFAGGVLGYLARSGDLSFDTLKKALVYGAVIASFTVEAFSTDGLERVSLEEVEERFKRMIEFTHFG